MGLEGLLSRLDILWSTKRKSDCGVDKVNLYKTNKLWGRSLLFFRCRVSKTPRGRKQGFKDFCIRHAVFFRSCFWTIKHFDLSLITFPLAFPRTFDYKRENSALKFGQFTFKYGVGYRILTIQL